MSNGVHSDFWTHAVLLFLGSPLWLFSGLNFHHYAAEQRHIPNPKRCWRTLVPPGGAPLLYLI